MYRKTYLLLLFIFILFLGGCGKSPPTELSFFSFDTYMDYKIYVGGSSNLLESLKEETENLEKIFNRHDQTSHLSTLNTEEEGNEKFQELLFLAKEVEKETDGAFNPYLGSVSSLWDFGSEEKKIPSNDDIIKKLEEAKQRQIEDLDLGGIAKGYAANQIQSLAKEKGVQSGIFNLGGNIITIGSYENRDFAIGIQDPKAPSGEIMGIVRFKENSAVTSGAYQRYFDLNGKRYHHILDPKTGYPVDNDLVSVTVILPDSARADAYSTALFVMGFDQAKSFSKEKKIPVLLLRKDGAIFLNTEGSFSFELRKKEDYYMSE